MNIDVRGLSFWYSSPPTWQLLRIDWRVGTGQIVGIVGPSGCGKTTLLKLIGGLLTPTAGKVLVGDRSPQLQQHLLGYVFQTPRLLPWRTAAENVALPLELNARRSHQNIDPLDALREVGLAGSASAYPNQLSGGMAQRVAIARAIVTRPELLLLDEPFGSLDVGTRQQMQTIVVRLRKSLGLTVIIITHDLAEAVFLCDRIAIMGLGTIRDEVDVEGVTAEERASLIPQLGESIRRAAGIVDATCTSLNRAISRREDFLHLGPRRS